MRKWNNRLETLARLGDWLETDPAELEAVKVMANQKNPWFTHNEIDRAITAIKDHLLSREALGALAEHYDLPDQTSRVKVGAILAGNIPLVGWHDLQCIYLSGHQGMVRFSSKDDTLIPFLLKKMSEWDSDIGQWVTITEQLKGIDAVIATGSNNTSRYFHEYFSKYPNIIRGHRNSLAVINGNESDEEILSIGEDIFSYFGLGCRNVTKLYFPRDADIERYISIWENAFSYVMDHHKYKNNYDYNFSIWLLNKEPFLASNALLLKEDPGLLARIASVHYTYYDELQEVEHDINNTEHLIQCVVSTIPLQGIRVVPPGSAQRPGWNDYADNIDTLAFLLNLETNE